MKFLTNDIFSLYYLLDRKLYRLIANALCAITFVILTLYVFGYMGGEITTSRDENFGAFPFVVTIVFIDYVVTSIFLYKANRVLSIFSLMFFIKIIKSVILLIVSMILSVGAVTVLVRLYPEKMVEDVNWIYPYVDIFIFFTYLIISMVNLIKFKKYK